MNRRVQEHGSAAGSSRGHAASNLLRDRRSRFQLQEAAKLVGGGDQNSLLPVERLHVYVEAPLDILQTLTALLSLNLAEREG